MAPYIAVNCPARVLFTPALKKSVTGEIGWNKTAAHKFCTVRREGTFARARNRGAEMIRMRTSKSSRRKADWIFSLAAWVLTALIGLQTTPTGVAAAPATAGKAEV